MSYASNSEFSRGYDRVTDAMLPVILLPAKEWMRKQASELGKRQNVPLPTLGSESSSNPDSLEALISNLSHPSWQVRIETVQYLEKAGKSVCLQMIKALQRALGDEKKQVRVAIVEILGSLGDDAPLESLMLALLDPYWNVRAAAAQALGTLGERTPLTYLLKQFHQEPDENVREALIEALGKRLHEIPEIFAAITVHDPSWLVREAAVSLLGRYGSQAPLDVLTQALLFDPDERVRAAAAKALGRAEKPEAEQVLFGALLDPNEQVRESVVWALWQFDEETRGQRMLPWESCLKQEAFVELTKFIEGKQGFVSQLRLVHTPQGWVILLQYFYQDRAGAMQDMMQDMIHSLSEQQLDETTYISSIESALEGQDEVVRTAIEQALQLKEHRSWQELLVVSFNLSSQPDESYQEPVSLRVISAGMSCRRVRQSDPPVLKQIATAWANTVQDLPICKQPPQMLGDLKVWYRTVPSCS